MFRIQGTKTKTGMLPTAFLMTGMFTTAAFGWSASGTVKTATGTPISGVLVSVKDSTSIASDTTDASGAFTIATLGTQATPKSTGFQAQVVGQELLLTSQRDGSIELALVDASGRSLWTAQTVAQQGTARVGLPTGLHRGAVFLRIKHGEGVEILAVTTGPEGLKLTGAARALAGNPVLVFKKTGYNDTTFAMTSASQTGIAMVMSSPSCPLPTTFKWKDYGAPVAGPKNNWSAIKDFSHVYYNGQHIVYMTYYQGGFKSAAMAPFTDWANAKDATQTSTNTGVAPEIMYFTPKKTWIMSKQWCSGASFCYMTSDDPTKPSSFAQKGNLLTETITDGGKAPIDQVLICDDNKCYLFYADDNGRIYRGSMPKANFPGTFTGTAKILQDSQSRLFEAVEVYKIKGQQLYLMIVECMSPRYFRAFTATDLGGTWTSLTGADTQAKPFAGKNNVTGGWSDDISHGDIVRSSYDEYREIDPCNLQMIYQGCKTCSGDYGLIPYQMGLLTFQK